MSLSRRLCAEALGSLLLAATVIGSGIMAQRLAGGNIAVALLANTGATVAVLATLIALLGPVSGAHFNPAVSLVEALRGKLSWSDTAVYAFVQVVGCCAGALLAHAMFQLPIVQASTHIRAGPAQWLSEGVATLGLVLVVLGHRRSEDAPWMVAAWIGAAYWFTAPHRLPIRRSRSRVRSRIPSPASARSTWRASSPRSFSVRCWATVWRGGCLRPLASARWRPRFRR